MKSQDIYMSATAVGDTAKRLGNYLLAEFCTLSRDQIKGGVADEMLRSVPGFQWKQPFTESEEDLDSENEETTDRGGSTSTRDVTPEEKEVPRERRSKGDVPGNGHEAGDGTQRSARRSPTPERKNDDGRYDDSYSRGEKSRVSSKSDRHGHRSSRLRPESSRESMDRPDRPVFKHPTAMDHVVMKRNRSDAEFSESAQSEGLSEGASPDGSDEGQSGRPRQRKRLSINTSVGPNLPGRQPSATHLNTATAQHSASLDVIGDTLRLKQQQQAIIEARQNAQFQNRGPMSADPRNAEGPPPQSAGGSGAAYEQSRRTSRRGSSPKFRNSKNLTIWTGESGHSSSRGGAMTAPADGPHGAHGGVSHPPSVLHPGRAHGSPSGASLLSPRHLNPAPGKSSKLSGRSADASRYNPAIHSANVPSAQSLMSPRGGEFPSRELPLPPHMHPHHHQQHHSSQQQQQLSQDRETGPPRSPLPPMSYSQGGGASGKSTSQNYPPPSPASAYPPPLQQQTSSGSMSASGGHHQSALSISKPAVLSFFESIYDQAEETARLQYTLRDQIRRSTAMLQTLQSSGQMIEGLVRGHFREMQVNYGEKFGSALYDLSRRVEKLEGTSGNASNITNDGGNRMDVDPPNGNLPATSTTSPGGTTTNITVPASASNAPQPPAAASSASSSSWGFKGGPPSANVNGAPTSLFLGGNPGDAEKGYEMIVKGIMDRLDKLEKRPAVAAAPSATLTGTPAASAPPAKDETESSAKP
ncbi:hypothetical protein DFJ77DRAFT_354520 [Powellomyces hirtus]|nr:hypothetical protein DFJ77DRAFT_354520 [Powellomyces hirtus]